MLQIYQMKPLFTLVLCLYFFAAFSQKPTYKEILKNEIFANEIESTEASKQKPYVIMVSIDGFRHDYAKKYNTKNILSITENGSSKSVWSLVSVQDFPESLYAGNWALSAEPRHYFQFLVVEKRVD